MKKLIIVFAVGVVLVGAFLLLRPRASRLPTATLPDGTQIILQAATYGTNHHFVHGSRLVQAFQRFTPAFVDRWFPPLIGITTTLGEEGLVIWYSAYKPATGKYVTLQPDQFSVIDDHRCTFPVNKYGDNQSPKFSVSRAMVRIFPRRQKTFTFRAKFVNYPPVDLKVPNPLNPITAEWTPEPLPAARKTNNLAVTLKSVRFKSPDRYLDTEFAILEDGNERQPGYEYKIVRTFRDATGNSSSNPYHPLCVHERAWKLEVDLSKTAQAPFPESAMWRIPNVTIPKPGELQMMTNENYLSGMLVRPIALCGAGDFAFSNEVCLFSTPWKEGWNQDFKTSGSRPDIRLEFRSDDPSLVAYVDGWSTSRDLLVRLQSPDGRGYDYQLHGSARNLRWYKVQNAEAGATMHLEFIPQKPVRFEFLVQPPRP